MRACRATLIIIALLVYSQFVFCVSAEPNTSKASSQPKRFVSSDGDVVELQGFSHGQPVFYTTHNERTALTIATDKVRPAGVLGYDLTGFNQILGMWESGVPLSDHVELEGRVRVGDDSKTVSQHATHTAGTMVGQGVLDQARGMASAATVLAHSWTDDLTEMSTAAQAGLTLSNHAYGVDAGWRCGLKNGLWGWYGDPTISPTEDYRFGYYMERARLWDSLIFRYPLYLIITPTGNDRNDYGPLPETEHWLITATDWTISKTQRERDGGQDGFDRALVHESIATLTADHPLSRV